MKIFYGAAIQGASNRKQRAQVNHFIINAIKDLGHQVITEHTTAESYEEAMEKLEQAIGPLPQNELDRRRYVRNKMIEAIEGDIQAAIFEVSIPSLGTGVEIAHAYLRPRMDLPKIPVLALYETGYWPNKLSTMIRGITKNEVSHFTLKEYTDLNETKHILKDFLSQLSEQ